VERQVFELLGVGKRYGEAPPVLTAISLVLREGETLAIVGPSGSGKSTLLNLLGALDRPTTGEVRFGGKNLAAADDITLARFRHREVGFVFQLHHLLPQLTALENVLLPVLAGPRGIVDDAALDRGRRLVERVGLGARRDARPGALSGGERQRVAVVRALVNQPRLLLADEPTGSLDAATAASLVDLLVDLNREERVAVVMVTHALPLARRMGRVLELNQGVLREA
jgi:ABC-type lipoprotein export system ATPase subunit